MSTTEFSQASSGATPTERTRVTDPILDLALAALGPEENPDLDGQRIDLFRDAIDRAKSLNQVYPHAPYDVLEAVDRVLDYAGDIGSGYSSVIIPREVQMGCIRTRIDDAMDLGDKGTACLWLGALETLRHFPSLGTTPRNTPSGS